MSDRVNPLELIRRQYGVPAARGARIRYQGKPGRITSGKDGLVAIHLDESPPRARRKYVHPADLEYLHELKPRQQDNYGLRDSSGNLIHGRAGTYRNHGCRCDPCSHAHEKMMRGILAKRRKRAKGFSIRGGYKLLAMQQGHPIARNGKLSEHRKVLYDAIGPGPHACYWNEVSGCGKTSLHWSGNAGIHVDHLDGDTLNNVPENLVVSCLQCNTNRGKSAWGAAS